MSSAVLAEQGGFADSLGEKRVYHLWKKGQSTQKEYEDVAVVCMAKIRKAQQELNLAMIVEDNKKYFYEYIYSKRRAKESLPPLFGAAGNIITEDKEKVYVLSGFCCLS